jgi:transposase
MGNYRLFYNKTIDYLKANYYFVFNPKNKITANFTTIRGAMKKTGDYKLPEWCKYGCYVHILDEAVRDCCKAYNSAQAACGKKNKKFNLKYKSRKESVQTLYLEKSFFGKHNRLAPSFGIGRLRLTNAKRRSRFINFEELTLQHDLRLQVTKLGEWNFIANFDFTRNETQITRRVIGLDPGVRTFLTGYDPDGRIVEVGKGSISRIKKLLLKTDKIRGLIAKTRSNRRKKSLTRALLGRNKEIKNLVDEFHWKTITFLRKYRVIFCGDIKVKSLVESYRTSHITKRTLHALRFYVFKRRLLEECPSTVLVNEAYTSKTCTQCGRINYRLGSSEVFNCGRCRLNIGRDVNAARNILIKGLLGATPL